MTGLMGLEQLQAVNMILLYNIPSHRSPGLGTGWGARPIVSGKKAGLINYSCGGNDGNT